MHDLCTYRIMIGDGLDEQTFNAGSPLQVAAAPLGAAGTLLTVRADQSGLVGLLRHLHQKGYLLRCLCREQTTRERRLLCQTMPLPTR